jgi:hypothetical protein
MATGRQLKAAILVRRAVKGPRKKRLRPEPRQYTVADLERARDRVAAAERRINNDRRSPNRGARGWSGRSSNCPSSSRNYACAASLSDGIELWRHPGEPVRAQGTAADVPALRDGFDWTWRSQECSADGGAACARRL